MNRRSFLNASSVTASFAVGTAGCGTNNYEPAQLKYDDSISKLAGYTLDELVGWYQQELFEKFLPFLNTYCIDHEYGGFMLNIKRDGTLFSSKKRAWFEGRGIWAYSFIYNKLDNNPAYLEVARKSVDFILKHKPENGGLWPETFSREGKALRGPDTRGFGSLFIANGLSEYSKAVNDETYWSIAKNILLSFMSYYDSNDFFPTANVDVRGPTRMLGTWMVLLRLVTQMLEFISDPEVEAIADRCVNAVLQYHLSPEFDLLCEYLNHDMSLPDSNDGQIVTGHSYEILWMLFLDAQRRNDPELLSTALRLFRRHIEVFWDDIYGGIFHRLDHVNKNVWGDSMNKVLWAQEEVCVGTLHAVELSDEQWAKDWFTKAYTHIREIRAISGAPVWLHRTDRKHKIEKFVHIEHFHHIRHLSLNLMCLKRLLNRGIPVPN